MVKFRTLGLLIVLLSLSFVLGTAKHSKKNIKKNSNNKKVICYFTDWAWYRPNQGQYGPDDIDPTLCTHIAYSFLLLEPSNSTVKPADPWVDIDNKFYQRVTSLRNSTRNNANGGVKVVVAIGGWTDSAGSKYSDMVNDPKKRKAFVKSVVQFVAQNGFDGVDLDWEYPKCWQGDCNAGPVSDKSAFTTLVKELRAALPKGAMISAAVSANTNVLAQGYDAKALSKYLDWIGVMDYDFHGPWDGYTGHIAPLYGSVGDENPNFNVNASIHAWIKAGARPEKLVLGIPAYGKSYTLKDQGANGMKVNTTGPGTAGTFTREPGTLSYYEICSRIKNDGWQVVQNKEGRNGPYAFKGDQWTSYDDPAIVKKKMEYANRMGLGGAMVWALDLDDFGNVCGGGKYPVIKAIKEGLEESASLVRTKRV